MSDRWLDLAARGWASLPVAVRRRVLAWSNHRVMIGVVGLIADPDGKVLLLEHRFRPPCPWGLPGGFLHAGEAPEIGLRRELAEEIGLEVELDREVFDTEYNLRGRYVSLTLLARPLGAPVLRSHEIRAAAYFDPGALPEATYPHHAAIVARWARQRIADPGGRR